MDYLKGKVSYLKGLAEGMQISDSTNEGKLFRAIIDVLNDIAITVDDIEEVQEQLSEQVDEIDEDLGEIESLLYEDEDDDECDCGEGVEEDICNTEFGCPHCGGTVNLVDAYMKKDSVLCPHCHKEIEIEWSCDCEECIDKEDVQDD